MNRKINFTVSIEDNDLIEYKLIEQLKSTLGNYLIDYMKFPNTEHLKEDKTFNKLLKAKKDAGLELDRYINNNRT